MPTGHQMLRATYHLSYWQLQQRRGVLTAFEREDRSQWRQHRLEGSMAVHMQEETHRVDASVHCFGTMEASSLILSVG